VLSFVQKSNKSFISQYGSVKAKTLLSKQDLRKNSLKLLFLCVQLLRDAARSLLLRRSMPPTLREAALRLCGSFYHDFA
jgi:hypothetical protein